MSDETSMAGSAAPADDGAVPITLVPADGLDAALEALPPAQAAWARAHGFAAGLGKALTLPDEAGGIARVLVGWGDAAAHRRQRFPLGGFAARAQPGTYRIETELAPEEAEAAALSWLLARYRYDRYRANGEEREALLAVPEGVDPARLAVIAEGAFLARDLINTPTNDMSPAALEAAARTLAERHGAEVSATVGPDLLRDNFPMIHAVGRAAATPPRLIDLTWGDPEAPMLTLVGKGVCFDTGGLNLKPASGMKLMKKDMGGAANILALAHMVMGLGLKVRLRVLIPAVENSVSGESFRPGDVLRSRKGLTVEVNNTDAEGRLVLADALALASEEAPDLILDMATLTGAARVAVGPDVVPFYTDDEDLAASLGTASARVQDPLWRLPLWAPYEELIEPQIADLDNAPAGGMAGSITAALFLGRFVDQTAWAHFDIFGWTQSAKPGRPKGGECQAARACLAMLEARYGAGGA